MKQVKEFKSVVDLSNVALEKWKAERMYAQGYRFVGKHSAVKICEWTKKGIRKCGSCYKNDFYGINSHQCVQMSPVAFFCDYNCLHCWRSLSFKLPSAEFKWDSPEEIFEGCLVEQKKILQGFKGKGNHDVEKIKEAEEPLHFAISLSGEPTLYLYLPEFIDLIKSKRMTAFLVTNGAHPEMLRKLLKHQPTNLYVTLHAPDEATFKKEVCPMIKDGWARLQESLELLKDFDCKTVVRLTLSKKTNMHSPEKYADLIRGCGCDFIECKGYMAVGGARAKMGMDAMPNFEEMKDFAKLISEKLEDYEVVNDKKGSCVVLLGRKIQ